MNYRIKSAGAFALLALAAAPVALSAQQQEPAETGSMVTVTGEVPTDLTGMPAGPDVEGIITARSGGKVQVTGNDGASTVVNVSQATKIRGSGGFLGLNRDKLASDSLLNGLPIAVETLQWGGGLIASEIMPHFGR